MFTPGPWRLLPLNSKYYGTEIDIDGDGYGDFKIWDTDYSEGVSPRELANGWTDEDGGYYDHTESAIGYANACLVAAAPDLYEALELAKHQESLSSRKVFTASCMEKINAALRKARGE